MPILCTALFSEWAVQGARGCQDVARRAVGAPGRRPRGGAPGRSGELSPKRFFNRFKVGGVVGMSAVDSCCAALSWRAGVLATDPGPSMCLLWTNGLSTRCLPWVERLLVSLAVLARVVGAVALMSHYLGSIRASFFFGGGAWRRRERGDEGHEEPRVA